MNEFSSEKIIGLSDTLMDPNSLVRLSLRSDAIILGSNARLFGSYIYNKKGTLWP